ncbi:hypothetical protein N8I77_006197 [Diaporthe amygdali]|uniref:Cyanovirin-N domain-containing protein n=1 Tax=Phomopsis amygdali TaxID=1214568 RepID=A0AAD9SG69_PHOAM|nr:hypothetical protein N8I77_006197 [Diaporthe amygdali]
MASFINLLVLSFFTLTVGAAPTTRDIGNYGNFSDYCMWPMYIDNPGNPTVTFDADCSSIKGGAGFSAQLANSQLDFNECFVNKGGILMPWKGGNAMKTCTCKIGLSACPDLPGGCPNTWMRCECHNGTPNTITVSKFDLGDYVGVTWSPEHQNNLLVCPAPNGDTIAKYQGCSKDGVTSPIDKCPS